LGGGGKEGIIKSKRGEAPDLVSLPPHIDIAKKGSRKSQRAISKRRV